MCYSRLKAILRVTNSLALCWWLFLDCIFKPINITIEISSNYIFIIIHSKIVINSFGCIIKIR